MVENWCGNYRKRLILVFCWISAFVAGAEILTQARYLSVVGNFKYYLGMMFPMLFEIKRKEWRNPIIAIVIISLVLCRGWIGLVCVLITYATLYWPTRKLLMIAVLAFVFAAGPAIGSKSKSSVFHDIGVRNEYYTRAVELWSTPAAGQGFGSYQKIPENQPTVRKDKLWLKWCHSDYVQGLYELGYVRMFFVLFFALIPFGYARMKEPIDRVIFASYLCVLLNALFDFPFHRPITAVVGAAIVYLQFTNLRTEKHTCSQI